MDIMLHQSNSSGYIVPEDETLCSAYEVLQKLIDDVEHLLRNTQCKSDFSSEQSDMTVKMDEMNCDSLVNLTSSSECKSGLKFGQPDLDINGRKTIHEDSQVTYPRTSECNIDYNSRHPDLGVCVEEINQEEPSDIDSSNEEFEDSFDGLNSERENHEVKKLFLFLSSFCNFIVYKNNLVH